MSEKHEKFISSLKEMKVINTKTDTMNAKDKAEELIEKFDGLVDEWNCYYDRPRDETLVLNDKIQCALICVDEIIKVCPYISMGNCDTIEQIRADKNQFVDYWQEVKKELQSKQQ